MLFLNLNANNSFGNVLKLKYYYYVGNDRAFFKSLADFDLKELSRKKLDEAVKELENIGDNFFKDGKTEEAIKVYNKVKDNSENHWEIYNKIENLKQKQGNYFYDIKNFGGQLLSLIKNNDSFFAIIFLAFSSTYFASIFIFFIFALILFLKYFKVFSNDALNVENSSTSLKKIIIFSITLLWPIIFLSGWMIFPFLISGLFWTFLSRHEKRATTIIIVLIFIFSVFFSIRSFLDNSIRSDSYDVVKEVNGGKFFSKLDYSKFDNELKVYLAFSYYENKNNNSALDILLSTGERYKSVFKYNLLGNIFYKSGNYEESMKYFKNSLDISDHNEVAIHNFTAVLALQKNEKVFNSYAERFPEIKLIKNNVHKIKEIIPNSGLLKRRALNSSEDSFSPLSFVSSILKEFIKLPVLYFTLILLLYIYFIKLLFSNLGESTRCSKCGKIIKETAVDASNKFCSDCYQLFMIKDVIFLEAKIAKEEKIRKKNFLKGILIGFFSLFFPGINLVFKEKYLSFISLLIVFYSIASFSIAGKIIFKNIFLSYPIIFNVTSVIAALLYLLINLYSVKGDSDGF